MSSEKKQFSEPRKFPSGEMFPSEISAQSQPRTWPLTDPPGSGKLQWSYFDILIVSTRAFWMVDQIDLIWHLVRYEQHATMVIMTTMVMMATVATMVTLSIEALVSQWQKRREPSPSKAHSRARMSEQPFKKDEDGWAWRWWRWRQWWWWWGWWWW